MAMPDKDTKEMLDTLKALGYKVPTMADVQKARADLYTAKELIHRLVGLGEDYAFFQSAQAAHRALQRAERALHDADVAF